MASTVGAQRSPADTGRLRYCAERVAENEGTFEFGPFCLRQSSAWHGVGYPITMALGLGLFGLDLVRSNCD